MTKEKQRDILLDNKQELNYEWIKLNLLQILIYYNYKLIQLMHDPNRIPSKVEKVGGKKTIVQHLIHESREYMSKCEQALSTNVALTFEGLSPSLLSSTPNFHLFSSFHFFLSFVIKFLF